MLALGQYSQTHSTGVGPLPPQTAPASCSLVPPTPDLDLHWPPTRLHPFRPFPAPLKTPLPLAGTWPGPHGVYHALFFAQNPAALTQLGWTLKFYDISFLYASTPQAKGKIEREHPFWQGRLPPCFASKHLTEIETANPHIGALRLHRNAHETQRELRMTQQNTWELARKEKRSVLRLAPRCPWWPYIWSVRTAIKVGSDGRVPIGPQRLRVERPPSAKAVLCLHPTGHHSVLAAPPDRKAKPVLLFTIAQMNLSCFANYKTFLF